MIHFRELTDIFPWLQDDRLALATWIAIVVVLGWLFQRIFVRRIRRSGTGTYSGPVAAGEAGGHAQVDWDSLEEAENRAVHTGGGSSFIISFLMLIIILCGASALALVIDPSLGETVRADYSLPLPALSEEIWLAVFGVCVVVFGVLLQMSFSSKRRAHTSPMEQQALSMAAGNDEPSPARWVTSGQQRETLDFARDAEAAMHQAPSRRSALFVLLLVAILVAFFGWAYFAKVEEVTRGEGRVIPSSKAQIVQSLEGGIVEGIEVAEGDRVKSGQVLLRIDDTGFSSDLGELEAKRVTLQAQIARLRAEASSERADKLVFPDGLAKEAPEAVANETNLYRIRKVSLDNQINVLGDRLEQKKLELAELEQTEKRLENGLAIAKEEHGIKQPLAERGIVPRTDLLKLEREISDLEGQLATTRTSIPRAKAAIREAERLAEERRLEFRQTAQEELNTRLSELSVVEQSLRAATDRVDRTEVRSPVDGVVHKLHVNTVGGVVRASEPMVEITPLEDDLLVEVRIEPKDIAFISPGQDALVKLSAYDFTVYGGLDAKVEIISSDSTVDETNNESYYLVTVRAFESSLKQGAEELPVLPGMVATVDIITGNKSILDYLLKPILKAQQEALSER